MCQQCQQNTNTGNTNQNTQNAQNQPLCAVAQQALNARQAAQNTQQAPQQTTPQQVVQAVCQTLPGVLQTLQQTPTVQNLPTLQHGLQTIQQAVPTVCGALQTASGNSAAINETIGQMVAEMRKACEKCMAQFTGDRCPHCKHPVLEDVVDRSRRGSRRQKRGREREPRHNRSGCKSKVHSKRRHSVKRRLPVKRRQPSRKVKRHAMTRLRSIRAHTKLHSVKTRCRKNVKRRSVKRHIKHNRTRSTKCQVKVHTRKRRCARKTSKRPKLETKKAGSRNFKKCICPGQACCKASKMGLACNKSESLTRQMGAKDIKRIGKKPKVETPKRGRKTKCGKRRTVKRHVRHNRTRSTKCQVKVHTRKRRCARKTSKRPKLETKKAGSQNSKKCICPGQACCKASKMGLACNKSESLTRKICAKDIKRIGKKPKVETPKRGRKTKCGSLKTGTLKPLKHDMSVKSKKGGKTKGTCGNKSGSKGSMRGKRRSLSSSNWPR